MLSVFTMNITLRYIGIEQDTIDENYMNFYLIKYIVKLNFAKNHLLATKHVLYIANYKSIFMIL